MLSRYETFLEVVRAQSMSKAAQNTHQTTPGVSYTISKLEDTLGVVLFTRNHSRIVPTPAAEALIPLIQRVVDAQQQVLDQAEAIRGADTGVVRIGGLRMATARWIPEILHRMQAQAPGISVQPQMNRYEETVNDLVDGKTDVAFCEDPHMKSFDYFKIMDDPYVVVLPEEHPLAGRAGIGLADIRAETVIIPEWPLEGSFGDDTAIEALSALAAYRIYDERTIIAMVQNGLGIAVLPGLLVPDGCRRVALIPFRDFRPKELGLLVSNTKYCTHAVKKFISVAMAYFLEIGLCGA